MTGRVPQRGGIDLGTLVMLTDSPVTAAGIVAVDPARFILEPGGTPDGPAAEKLEIARDRIRRDRDLLKLPEAMLVHTPTGTCMPLLGPPSAARIIAPTQWVVDGQVWDSTAQGGDQNVLGSIRFMTVNHRVVVLVTHRDFTAGQALVREAGLPVKSSTLAGTQLSATGRRARVSLEVPRPLAAMMSRVMAGNNYAALICDTRLRVRTL